MTSADQPRDYVASDFNFDAVRAAKANTSVAVIVPARDEAATLPLVLRAVLAHEELIDELVVVDDHSRDTTALEALRHGAKVVENAGPSGKGAAMAAGAAATSSDLIVFLDGDVRNMTPDYVARLLQPLLERPRVQLVKGYYERPLFNLPTGGGRVNDLTARPVLALLFPGLDQVRQPLAGESALRRSLLDHVHFEPGYGVEIALLIDVARAYGLDAIAEVDLGVREHRNRSLDELRPMAEEILRVAFSRARS
ncbi:MAG: glucosyl-3-phosphoglycerate synthase [Acidobacteriota bacterium]|nr:glucosyl-3-phosphoglycerate synthase [Acidobacteriota bacterium]MDE3044535.1 glucosyl-3-phosphoglycerate synthase [Acidobacteriota bacterium]MDE3107912.1 glucosyl-3-phosphoglycerate synthase [Acidobacteriota bacterium]MDE3223743.1 glucosyl-3-phosphoglycerate synthase [Acidobacteriota bacterium]